LTSRTRRGGPGRPVDLSRRTFFSTVLAAAWLATVAAGSATGHGGVPILQAASERVNPGGTLDLLGDMTTEGSVQILLGAPSDAVVWTLGSADADHEGHFRVFLVVPVDLPAGDYRIRARMATEEATTRIVVSGPPIVEGGGRPGQDEALAGVQPDPGVAAPNATGVAVPPSVTPVRGPGPDLTLAVGAVALGIATAALLGLVARARSRRGADA
jgi:hypothetical protein